MKNRYTVFCCSLALGLLVSSTAQAFVGGIVVASSRASEVGEITVSFTAEAKVETEENKFTTRVHYRPGMVRDEMKMGNQTMTIIQRYDLDKVWILMGQGMYMEHQIGASQQAPDYELIERSVVGTETINGIETTKYKTIYQGPRGKFGGFTWMNEDNIAIKGFIVSEEHGEKQRILFTLENLEYGEQSQSLFEVPAGWRKFDMPGFSGMVNQSGGATYTDTQYESGDSSFADELMDVAVDAAEEEAKREAKEETRDKVQNKLKKLFGD